jgi:pimeloyl-ACP methyl ester carboxylesterase
VLVFPGLTASDGSTLPLRTYLKQLGYDVSGWNQGYNFGPRAGVLEAAREQILETVRNTGQPVSLIGWSLGGVYARELAKALPDQVRCVITLGTPFSGGPASTNASRLYELAAGHRIADVQKAFDLPCAPPVPTTSIYSRTDGVVAWQASIQAADSAQPDTENIEVFASHIGLGVNPSAWWAIADRLSQRPYQWKPFVREHPITRCFFPVRSGP